MHQIDLFIKYPHDVQREWQRKLVHSARFTEFGQTHGFKDIETLADFQRQVPIRTHDQLKPYIDRLMAGEQNLLWPSEVKWFAKSSGTTSDRSKFIPVTKESLEDCHFRGGKDMLSIWCHNNPDTRIFSGKSLTIGGSHRINQIDQDSYYGDLSAVLIKNLPMWAEFHRTPDPQVALMEEWDAKLDAMAKITPDETVTSISGVPSWSMVLCKKILDYTGKKNLKEVWPDLEVFFHGGVSFDPYRSEFEKMVGSANMGFLETYNASEGFFGIQDQSDDDSLLLMLDYGIFYEFVSTSELDSDDPKVLTLDQVECDQDYALIISTNGGLWRYNTGDVIRFTSTDPYKIRIAGRTKHFINAFGEELQIHNAESAIKTACERTGASVSDYTVGPIFFAGDQNGAHEWLIEFSQTPEDLDRFNEVLDTALKSVNSDYEAKRYSDLVLRQPMIKVLPQGSFSSWLKHKGKLGGQHKVPRLANDRKLITEISEFLSTDHESAVTRPL